MNESGNREQEIFYESLSTQERAYYEQNASFFRKLFNTANVVRYLSAALTIGLLLFVKGNPDNEFAWQLILSSVGGQLAYALFPSDWSHSRTTFAMIVVIALMAVLGKL
ncbi:MAG: hypothetical protein RIR53_617 [Bacteroidota bacterium]|jgi:hypothetical protein